MSTKINRQDTLDHKIEVTESFGVTLKRERELRSIPLEDVAQSTNIQVSYLKALEEDNYDILPHTTFVRGFIRSYAKYIGLNPDNAIANYEHFVASFPGEETGEESVESQNKKNKWLLVVVVFLSLFILVFLGYYVVVTMRTLKKPPTSTMQVQPMSPPEYETQPSNHETTRPPTDSKGLPPPTITIPDIQDKAQPKPHSSSGSQRRNHEITEQSADSEGVSPPSATQVQSVPSLEYETESSAHHTSRPSTDIEAQVPVIDTDLQETVQPELHSNSEDQSQSHEITKPSADNEGILPPSAIEPDLQDFVQPE
jgi:cytoskeletal protein RodZ